ncbi:MAG: heme NO-binding domain-containing protein [Saprospiraceae bacterium]
MKGIVFTEFLEMVEDKFGYEVTEKMISSADLPSKGAYTAVGTYDHSEMYSMIGELHKSTEIPVPALMHTYGLHLFGALAKAYAPMLSNLSSAFEMLQSVDQYIHVEVRKLYPDAELPHFEIQHIDDNKMVMIYTSERRMSDIASGLIEGCLAHYNEEATVHKEMIVADGSKVKFEIIKN